MRFDDSTPAHRHFRGTTMNPKELEDVIPIREKAVRHLTTWTKKQLVQQLSFSAKFVWLERWAEEYDKGKQRGER